MKCLLANSADQHQTAPVSWAQLMTSRAHPFPFTALSFPNLKKVPIYCWFDRASEFSNHQTAKPSLELKTFWQLCAPKSSCSYHSTTAPLNQMDVNSELLSELRSSIMVTCMGIDNGTGTAKNITTQTDCMN